MTMESSYRIVRETSVYPCQQETYPRRLNAMPAPVRRTAATRPPISPDSTCKCNGWFRVGLF